MKNTKKVVYYYYDTKSNRRPLSLSDLDDSIFTHHDSRLKFFKEINDDLDNLYIQIDGVEFKLF